MSPNPEPLLATEPSVLTLHVREQNALQDKEPVADDRMVIRQACVLLSGIALACFASLGLSAVWSMQYPLVMSHSLLAFGLGLRHAVDCDHLAAIDNVTRQLLVRGQRPVSVGFWFAVGHSTVVMVMTAMLAGGYSMAWHHFGGDSDLTGAVSLGAAIVSVSLLAGIGLLNARCAIDLFRRWIGLARCSPTQQEELFGNLAQESLGGALTSLPCLRRAFKHVDRPSKMWLVGLMFGLSFDTATQVSLIGLAAISGTEQRMPPYMIMVFPLCFSCGMCLIDTANGLLMLLTYSWANIRPVQKVFYNLVVTALSAIVALAVGSLELLQIIGKQCHFKGAFWNAIENVDMGSLGYMLIGTFILALTVAFCGSHFAGRIACTDTDSADKSLCCEI